MKLYVLLFTLVLIAIGAIWYRFIRFKQPPAALSPIVEIIKRPLDKYTVDNLTKRRGIASKIMLGEAIATTSAFTVRTFQFDSDGKKVSGLAHIPALPESTEGFPVIVQIRGYVDPAVYEPGVGTRRSAEVFATHGFLSLAPDYLGYGASDTPPNDVFEERFKTYTVTLDLLASIPSLSLANAGRIGLWAHSNGGQIALTVLEITRAIYPTVLWAPVTRAFPYSILYYTDEADDKGKALRKKLAEFERNYDVDLFTMVNFTDRIVAPIQIHQGDMDEAVPERWSSEFVTQLKEKNIDVDYYVYPGADHNMQPGWNTAVVRSIEFFRAHGIR